MALTASKRQDPNESFFLDLLQKTRCEENGPSLSEQDAEFFCQFALNDPSKFSEKEANFLKNQPDTMFLFANNEDREKHNEKALFLAHSEEFPLAVIRDQMFNIHGKKVPKKHFETSSNSMVPVSTLCIGAKVQITGKNFKPQWGLYNSAMGIVRDIVFKKEQNPNLGHLPEYVLVEFRL